MTLKLGTGAFAQPKGDIWTETPDGVNRAYDDGEVRNSLNDARFVCDGYGYDAFRNERYPEGFLPMGDDDGSTSNTTGTSSKKPLGRQR
jgi:hypothetical protein